MAFLHIVLGFLNALVLPFLKFFPPTFLLLCTSFSLSSHTPVNDLWRGFLTGHLGQSGQPSGQSMSASVLSAVKIYLFRGVVAAEPEALFALGWTRFT